MATNFYTRPEFTESLIPEVLFNESVLNPVGPTEAWRPANWLPVQWIATNRDAGSDAFVHMKGKPVCITRDQYLAPAGLRGAFDETTATVVLTYTADDYAWGVIDLTTGARYATNGTTTYTALDVAKALVERGLVPEDTVSNNPPSSNADVTAIVKAFFSLPIGFAAYSWYVWSGKAEDGDQFYTNYSKQSGVQFFTQWVLKVPVRVASDTDADSFDVSAITVTTAPSAVGDFPQPGEVWNAAALSALSRYTGLSTTAKVTGLALASKPVARNTDRTPIVCDITGVLKAEKDSILKVKKEGDWFCDLSVGMLFISSDTYATLVTDNTDPTVSYFYYDDSAAGDITDKFVYFDGVLRPGDLISCDNKSNYVPKGSAADILASTDPALGRVLYALKEPFAEMETKVSGWKGPNFDAASKMPGTATKGYSDMITLAGDTVADTLAILMIRM